MTSRSAWHGARAFLFTCFLLIPPNLVRGNPPAVEALFPAGAATASTNEISLVGKFSPWPPRVWTDGPGLSFQAKTNQGKFVVSISADAEPGPRLVRFFNEEGASDLRFFVVGSTREITENEPNNHFVAPQSIDPVPVTINGRLDKKDDVDSFAISLRAGQWLEARADCHLLMSKADLVLRLVTTNGVQLTWNHDFVALDPRLIWQAPNDCTVILQSFGFAYPADSEIRFTGGDATAYRLHVTTTNDRPRLCTPSTNRRPPDGSTELALPSTVAGVIEQADEEHRYQVNLEKGEWMEAKVEAVAFGSPLDAWLRVENASGEVLSRNDDADGSSDPRLEWKALEQGVFTLALGSTTHRGGPEHCYEMSLRKVTPDYHATLGASAVALTAGTTNELKLNIKRLRGFTNELEVACLDLPNGVSALPATFSREGAVIRLFADDTALASQGPIQVVCREPGQPERIVPFELTSRSEDNGVPGGYGTLLRSRTDYLWLTVIPKKVEPPQEDNERAHQ